jgi:phosphate transport system substrate-binding protein
VNTKIPLRPLALALLAGTVTACKAPPPPPPASAVGSALAKRTVRHGTSANLLELARSWADARARLDSSISVQVEGGPGADDGIAALVGGSADLALATRPLQPSEIEPLRQRAAGKPPRDFIAGFEAACVYVNKANPLSEITVGSLAGVFGEGSRARSWKDLQVKAIGRHGSEKIVRVGAATGSSTSRLFAETVLGAKARELPDVLEASRLADALALVAATPGAIAYGACRPVTEVKIVPVSPRPGAPAAAPTRQSIARSSYPLARPLLLHMSADAPAPVQNYVDWLLSPSGQRVIEEQGFLPAPMS